MTAPPDAAGSRLDLFWIPLGAGDHVVQTSGRIYESLLARLQHRSPSDLYHSALVAHVPEGRVVVEMTPVPSGSQDRGVVAEGAVGSQLLGRLRVFRYEIRRWRDGVIPDLRFAVASPVRLTSDSREVRDAMAWVERVPTPVWGRDQFAAGEMWNSNSVVSWVLERANLLERAGRPPLHGRAPGWDAGVVVAKRHAPTAPRPATATSVSAGTRRRGGR